MRIAAVKSWLLAALSLASPAASQEGGAAGGIPDVEFDLNQGFTEQPGGPAIIVVNTASELRHSFNWTSQDKVKVKSVSLYVNITEVNKDGIRETWSRPIGIAESPNDKLIFHREEGILTTNFRNVTMDVTLESTGGTVAIKNLRDLVQTEIVGKPLYFEAHWSKEDKPGTSYSRWFTAYATETDQTIQNGVNQNQLFSNLKPAHDEVFPVEDSPSGAVGKPSQSSSITPTSTPQPTTTGNTSDNNGQDISGTKNPSSSKSKKGLSIGAIVGIAIACGLLGLALIGGIVFFCLRRRQKQNALGGGTSRGVPYGGFASGGGRNGGDELMAEKEANAGVIHDVTSAPHSPYSDDGNHQQHLMGMGGAGAGANRNSGSVVIPNIGSGVSPHVVLPGVDGRLEGGDGGSPVSNAPSHNMQQQQIQHDHQSGRSYTMYSDHQSGGGGGGSPTTLHSGGGAPSLTHGGAGTESNRGSLISQQQQGRSLSTPYAHLVEEGMTEEEIRRLEEEERQLDAAIEQHAGGRRGSRNL